MLIQVKIRSDLVGVTLKFNLIGLIVYCSYQEQESPLLNRGKYFVEKCKLVQQSHFIYQKLYQYYALYFQPILATSDILVTDSVLILGIKKNLKSNQVNTYKFASTACSSILYFWRGHGQAPEA